MAPKRQPTTVKKCPGNEMLSGKNLMIDKKVEELYLGWKGITDLGSLGRFRFLKYLWLNNNKHVNIFRIRSYCISESNVVELASLDIIKEKAPLTLIAYSFFKKFRRLSCLNHNRLLSELYLQNNELTDITDALAHLTCLQVLLLHNNQLTRLEKVVHEFRKMHFLHILSLFDNPAAQETDYRNYVIFHIPSVKILDRKNVEIAEVAAARRTYNQQFEHTKRTIAFGKKLPKSVITASKMKQGSIKPDDMPQDVQMFESFEDALLDRRLKKAVTMYNSFNWSKLPRIETRRTTDKIFDEPEIITHIYR